jgi:uncharacterized membrane protein HdeD (DUF308 family)
MRPLKSTNRVRTQKMKAKHKIIIFVDGIINIILGALLLLFPFGVAEVLGLPIASTNFYPSILGAVLIGIGVALFVEIFSFVKRVRGLGLGGAIAINLIGALVLLCWLVFGTLSIPLKGRIILWVVGIVVLVIGLFELFIKSCKYDS